MSKQTAVEWLYERLERMIPKTALYNMDKKIYFEQAKQMEKEQIIKTAQDNFYAGQDLANGYKIDWDSSEQYYNETYGGQDDN
jgi:hypothetical protein